MHKSAHPWKLGRHRRLEFVGINPSPPPQTYSQTLRPTSPFFSLSTGASDEGHSCQLTAPSMAVAGFPGISPQNKGFRYRKPIEKKGPPPPGCVDREPSEKKRKFGRCSRTCLPTFPHPRHVNTAGWQTKSADVPIPCL